MSVTWYAKLDCNFHSNRKMRKAGRLGRELFVYVLCTNAQKGSTGSFSVDELDPGYLAEMLQMTTAEVHKGIEACQAASLISIANGEVSIIGWTDEYGRRPLTSTERMAQKRARDKVIKITKCDDVTEASSHVTDRVTGETSRDVGRKEGREGSHVTLAEGPDPVPTYDSSNATQRGKLAQQIWQRVSDARIRLAAEFGKSPPKPFPPITPATSGSGGFRELCLRIGEEGPDAPSICEHVFESLIADARAKRSIDWLSEKAFTEGGWRTARERVPKWRTGGFVRTPVGDDDFEPMPVWTERAS